MSLADQQWSPTSVQVTVLQARGLRIKGKSGTNDAYAVMQVGKDKYQTSVVEKSVAPVWKEEASFDLPPPPLQAGGGGGGRDRSTLRVQVLHRALVGPDKLLGQAVINLLQLSEDKTRNKTEWFKLLDKTGKPDKDRGEVLLDVQFMRNNMTASMFDLSAAGKSRSRLGKLKDKVRGKKKELDSSSGVMLSPTQVLTDSEEEEASGGGERGKSKQSKRMSLFSPKSNLQRNLSQSMSVLPAKNSSLSGSQSSGLNMDSSEGKKKFKFKMHKHSSSSDSKNSSSGQQKQEQSNLCINGSHIYCEELPPRTSRAGSSFSLSSSGRGSMEDVLENPSQSVESLKVVREYSPWMEEEEDEEKEEEDENIKDLRKEEEEKAKLEKDMREEEEEAIRKQQKELERLAEEKLRQEEEEKVRKEEEQRQKLAEEERRLEEQEKRRREEEERIEEEERARERRRQEGEHKLAEEKRRLKEEEERRIEEEKVRREREIAEEERRKREQEETKRREEEEMLRKEKMRIEEEEKAHREKEEARLMAEKRREEERVEAEEKFRKEEEERIKMEEEMRRKEHEEKLAKRKELEEQERRAREEQEKVQREEEERRKQEEEEEKLTKEKLRQEEEERRKAAAAEEEQARREEEDRIQKEKIRREEEERKKKEEEEECERRQEELEKLAKEKLREEERRKVEEEQARREEEERIQKEKIRREKEERKKKEEEEECKRRQEELEKLAKEKLRKEEEERRKVEEEQARREEERIQKEKIREEEEKAEKQRLEDEMREAKRKEERMKEEQAKMQEEEEKRKRAAEEERIKVEKQREEELEKMRLEEERMRGEERNEKERREEEIRKQEKLAKERKENKIKAEEKSVGTKIKLRVPVEITSSNPFDENFTPPEETPQSSKAKPDAQRCQSSAESGAASTSEKDPTNIQREKRAAPKPPGRNQQERQKQKEEETSTQHLPQINKQSKDKDVKTVSVAPQRSVQMIAPLNRSSKDLRNTQSVTEHESAKEATGKHNKRPAPSTPCATEDELHRGAVEIKDGAICGLNPFEDDEEEENEFTVRKDATTFVKTDPVVWPPVKSQAADKDSAKVKSSKVARAPLPPDPNGAPSSSTVRRNHDETDVLDGSGDTAPNEARNAQQEVKSHVQVQESPNKESKKIVTMAGAREEGPPVISRRLQPVKPLNPLEQQSDSVGKVGNDNKATGLDCNGVQHKTNVGTGRSGPFSQLTREELIALLLKQESQLSERDKKISELEQYIDNLLVRVIEESPSILMSMSSLKKPA